MMVVLGSADFVLRTGRNLKIKHPIFHGSGNIAVFDNPGINHDKNLRSQLFLCYVFGMCFRFTMEENPHDAGKRGVISTGHGACRTTNSVVLPKKVASKNC